jgi:hypothetical protein
MSFAEIASLRALFFITLLGATFARHQSHNITFPPSPVGAILLQIQPCQGVSASIPSFANSQYEQSTASTAYIVQHGSDRDGDEYFAALYSIIGEKAPIIAPNFYLHHDISAPLTWYQPHRNLAWRGSEYTWKIGSDASAPIAGHYALRGRECSSFEVYDHFLTHFGNKRLFPNLNQVTFVSHSGGSSMVSHYSQIHDGRTHFSIRYVLSNAPHQAYFTSVRPVEEYCQAASHYPFQLVRRGMPRYIAARFTNARYMFQRWISRDVILIVGWLDTALLYPGGVQDCGSRAQGGRNRRDRDEVYWTYINILAGRNASVSREMGYHRLMANGAQSLTSHRTAFHHKHCIVPDAGHDQYDIFRSGCGRAAIAGRRVGQ